MTLGSTSLRFSAVTSGATFVYQTGTQVVPLTQSGAGTVTWTATPSQPWLQVSPTSGTGPANLSISVVPRPDCRRAARSTGSIAFTFTGAANSPGPIDGAAQPRPRRLSSDYPFGNVDTPTDNRTGVTGAIPFTGWLLDDVDVDARHDLPLCRSAPKWRPSTRTAPATRRSSSASARSSRARGLTSPRPFPPIPATPGRAGASWS